MSSAEPLGVAFVEIEPVAAGFRTKTEAQIRSQLAGVTTAGIPPSPATAASTRQLQGLGVAAGEATAAEELLARAQGELAAATAPLAALQTHAAKAHVAAARSAAADAAAQKALLAITEETDAAIVAEIEALAVKTRALSIAAAAEERAALATETHAAASTHATEAILAETASLSGLRGASLGVNPVFLAATAGAIAFFESAKLADEFKEQMHLIAETTDATSDEIDRAAATARGLGRDLSLPGTSAVESAQAIRLLTQSGFDLDDSLTAARGALLLTAASGEDLQGSVREIDRLLDAFRLHAEDSGRAADAVATGLKFTQGSAEEFAGALATLAPAADSVGLSLEETNTLVLQLSESGLAAGQGAATLRQAFLRLARGGKDVNEGLAAVGLSLRALRDEEGNLRPDAFARIADAMQDLDRAERLRILTQIFSRRAALGVIRLVDQQREGFVRMTEESRRTGVAQGLAEARVKSLGGTIRETKDEAADFATVLGGLVLPVATSLAAGTGDLFHGLNLLAGGFQQLVDPPRAAARSLGDMKRELQDAQDDMRRFRASSNDTPPPALQRRIDDATKALSAFGDVTDIVSGKLTIFDAVAGGVTDTIGGLVDALNANVPAQNQVNQVGETLATQLALAEASGNEDEQLRILRQQSANAIKRQQQARTNPNLNQAQANAQITKAAQDQKTADDKIQAILDGRVSDTKAAAAKAKAAAGEIERAADERDRNFIAAIEAGVSTRQGTVAAKSATDALSDDIHANVVLRKYLTSSIERIQARIREVRAAGRSAKDLVTELASLRVDKNQVIAAIKALNQQSRDQTAETRVESAQLDLQILEARVGDDPTARQTTALVNAHLRVIAALRKAQGLTKKRSIEWKRLQLDIENELSAIRDLKKAQSDAAGETKDFSQQAFAFLQELHGFSSNLASNILPTGSTIGTGGVFSATPSTSTTAPPFARPPGAPNPNILSPFEHGRGRGGDTTGAAALREQRGGPATFGQMEKLLHVTQNTNAILRDLRRGVGHPEAHHIRQQGKHPVETGVD